MNLQDAKDDLASLFELETELRTAKNRQYFLERRIDDDSDQIKSFEFSIGVFEKKIASL